MEKITIMEQLIHRKEIKMLKKLLTIILFTTFFLHATPSESGGKIDTSSLNTITYEYDNLNRVVKATYESGETISYSYDAGGNLVKVIYDNADKTDKPNLAFDKETLWEDVLVINPKKPKNGKPYKNEQVFLNEGIAFASIFMNKSQVRIDATNRSLVLAQAYLDEKPITKMEIPTNSYFKAGFRAWVSDDIGYLIKNSGKHTLKIILDPNKKIDESDETDNIIERTFYVMSRDGDSDGDGIKDIDEGIVDTDGDEKVNFLDTDSDNDGISDANELKYGLNPLDPSDATQDADGDGVSNIDEINSGSNPTDANSIPKNRLIAIYFGKDKKITPSQETNITLIAEKELANYPKNVKIAIDYENSTIDANDINISKGYNFKFENNSTVSHILKFKNSAVCSDDLSSKVTFKIDALDSGLINSGDKQTIYLVCHKELRAKVRFMQDGKYITPVIHDTTKPIVLKIESNQLDGVTYDIKDSNSILLSYVNKLDKNSIEFNLNGIEDGAYDLVINITKGDEKLTIKRVIVVKSENKDTEQDSDNDGIVDSYDKVSEDNKIQTQLKGNSYLIEVRDGEKIALGNLALKLGEQKASIDVNKIKKPKNYKVKEVFDFRVSNLEKGESTYVVLPLKEPISKNQKFVKYYESGDIKDFAIDAKNKIFTAKSLSQGLCPIPGSNSYKEGLNIGDNCIELLIEDGGANDQDNEVNGEVLDPNAIVEKEQKQGDDGSDAISSNNSHTPTPPETDCCGVTDYSFILLIVLLMLFRRENAKKV